MLAILRLADANHMSPRLRTILQVPMLQLHRDCLQLSLKVDQQTLSSFVRGFYEDGLLVDLEQMEQLFILSDCLQVSFCYWLTIAWQPLYRSCSVWCSCQLCRWIGCQSLVPKLYSVIDKPMDLRQGSWRSSSATKRQRRHGNS